LKDLRFCEAGMMPGTQFIKLKVNNPQLPQLFRLVPTGSRVFTASSANGIMYMAELLPWAAGNRLPIVMCDVTRALGAPWCVWSDHNDIFTGSRLRMDYFI